MRIEVTEDRLSDTDTDTGQHYVQLKGDIITVPDAYGKRLCDRGWVKDVENKYESKPRVPGAVRVEPRKVKVPPAKKGS